MAARKSWLIDALRDVVKDVDPKTLKKELAAYVPDDAQRILAAAGIRDEEVFPVPSILRGKPTLVGYYRLLLGISQKQFYRGSTGLGRFKLMEEKDVLRKQTDALLPDFCKAMCDALADLVRQIPNLASRDVEDLPLLTLGSKFYGSNNNQIGRQAIQDVFLAIGDLVDDHVTNRGDDFLEVTNSAGRKITISLAADPDVRIEEEFGSELRKQVAIEVKGGTDASNAHNRAGEAEKSHQKARTKGFRECWTIIATTNVDRGVLKSESSSTSQWFDIAEVLGREGKDWEDFRSRIAGAVGIPLS